MSTIDRVLHMPVWEFKAHAIAYGLRGPMELTAMVEAVARAIEADERRAVRA